jgi:hypothetical protein
MVVSFEINGQEFTALNGGPLFKISEAVSFQVMCESQDEVDYYWDKLSEGGRRKGPGLRLAQGQIRRLLADHPHRVPGNTERPGRSKSTAGHDRDVPNEETRHERAQESGRAKIVTKVFSCLSISTLPIRLIDKPTSHTENKP